MNMKLKFFIAGVAIVAGLASAVSCQDLSKDLTALQNKVNSLESTVQNLQAKIDAGAVITSVTPTNSGIVITLSNGNKYEITNGVNGKDGSNGTNGKDGKDGKDGSVVTIGENGNWFIDGEDTGLAAQGEDGVPGAFYVPNPETGCFDLCTWDEEKGEYVVTPTEISFLAPGTITAVYDPETGILTLFNVEGGEGELGIVTIGGTASEVATIELFKDYTAADQTFKYCVVGENTIFGKGLPGAIEFTKGDQVQTPTGTIIVSVSPANYDLSAHADEIMLVNTAGTVFDQAVASVKKYTTVDTKAVTNNGLWEITFELIKYNAKEFKAATVKKVEGVDKKVLFAIKAGEAISKFDLTLDAAKAVPENEFVTNLLIDKKTQNASTVHNRVTDKTWNGNTPDYKGAKSASADGTDTRTGKADYNVVVGTPVKIFTEKNVKAMYVTLDIENATESGVSEKNAWLSYDIDGLDTVVEGKELSFTINDAKAKGDEIGFRVWAVNYDGTLVDPDGTAIYVLVGGAGSDGAPAVTTLSKPNEYLTTPNPVSNTVAISAKKLATATKYDFAMDDDKAPVFNVVLCGSDGKKLGKVITPGTNQSLDDDWKITSDVDVKKLYAVTTEPLYKYEDDKVYTATLTFKDGDGFALASQSVSFQKVLPIATPTGYSIKTGQLDAEGNYNCYLIPNAWTAKTATLGTMDMESVFNFPTGLAAKYVIEFADTDEDTDDGKTYYPVPAYAFGSGAVTVRNQLPKLKTVLIDNQTKHNTTVYFNYGDVSSVAHKATLDLLKTYDLDINGDSKIDDTDVVLSGYADVMLSVDNFNTIYNCIYNSTYTWDWNWGKNDAKPADAYGYAYNKVWKTEIEATPYAKALAVVPAAENETPQIVYEEFDGGSINMKWADGTSAWDGKYSATLDAPISGSLSVESAKLTSDANGVEDYYKVAVSGTKFTFTKQSSATNPVAAVPSTLTIKCKDMYNHDVVIKLPVKVMPRK